MIRTEKLFYRKRNDSIHSTLEQMRKIPSGHVPVLDENGKVIGVFTAVSFLNITADTFEIYGALHMSDCHERAALHVEYFYRHVVCARDMERTARDNHRKRA